MSRLRSWRLDGQADPALEPTTFAVLARERGAPWIAHFGGRLGRDVDFDLLGSSATFARAPAEPDHKAEPGLAPCSGFGFFGAPALRGGRAGGRDFAQAFELEDARGPIVDAFGEHLRFSLLDDVAQLRLVLDYRLDPFSGVLSARASLENLAAEPFFLEWLAALTLPLPAGEAEAISFEGRWAKEFALATTPLPTGLFERASRRGKPGQANPPQIVVGEAGLGEDRGEAIGAALAWSGGFRLFVETDEDGSRRLQLGALAQPGEATLARDGLHVTPWAHAAWTSSGLNGLSAAFHHFHRTRIATANAQRPRLVHANSWEAVYFRHERRRLFDLIDAAAELGVERFVLDDGWFSGRDDDSSSLGDWQVDEAKHPGGLTPIAEQARGRGMSFGLWVEPEMISQDSALYRSRPDWALALPERGLPTERNQLVLDLSKREVLDYLFDSLDGLLSEAPIDYLKWDHNRSLFPPAGEDGAPSSLAQVEGFYALLERVRAAHPDVEIETCAGGGGRVDFAVLRMAERFWASDQNDAIERAAIQRGASIFFPLETIGAHVGPSPSHQTGRMLDIGFRAAVAMFGHMGIECDLTTLTPAERQVLAAWFAHYKAHRDVLHAGRLRRFAIDGSAMGQIAITRDGSRAVAQALQTETSRWTHAARTRLPGLDANARYRIRALEPWCAAADRLHDPDLLRTGALTLDGASLAHHGLALPLHLPASYWVLSLERI